MELPDAGNMIDAVLADLKAELLRSARLHQHYTFDPLRRSALVVEEAGEALQAALDLTRPIPDPATVSMERLTWLRNKLYQETIETAAMAITHAAAMKMEESVWVDAMKEKIAQIRAAQAQPAPSAVAPPSAIDDLDKLLLDAPALPPSKLKLVN